MQGFFSSFYKTDALLPTISFVLVNFRNNSRVAKVRAGQSAESYCCRRELRFFPTLTVPAKTFRSTYLVCSRMSVPRCFLLSCSHNSKVVTRAMLGLKKKKKVFLSLENFFPNLNCTAKYILYLYLHSHLNRYLFLNIYFCIYLRVRQRG